MKTIQNTSKILVVLFIFLLFISQIFSANTSKMINAYNGSIPTTCLLGGEQFCVIYRRSSYSKESVKQWRASIDNEVQTSIATEVNQSSGEAYFLFQFSNVTSIPTQKTLHLRGSTATSDYNLKDVVSGREVLTSKGSTVYIQENDNGVYQTLSQMNAHIPLKAAYFERFHSSGRGSTTFKTNQMIFSTYRSDQESPYNATGTVNNNPISNVLITRTAYTNGVKNKQEYSISAQNVKSLGYSHYRILLPFTLTANDLKAVYTIEIVTPEKTFFSGESYNYSINKSTNLNFQEDYANGVHFYDLFNTPDFTSTLTSTAQLGVISGATSSEKFVRVWAPFATDVKLELKSGTQNPRLISGQASTTGVHEFYINGISPTDENFYTIVVNNYPYHTPDNSKRVVDPYAVATANDGFSALLLNHSDPALSIPNFVSHTPTKKENAIIYESHIVDQTWNEVKTAANPKPVPTYTNFANSKSLSDAKTLGFNYLHILPIQENRRNNNAGDQKVFTVGYENNNGDSAYTWGYGPQNLFAMEGSFSTLNTNTAQSAISRVKEVKTMVQTLQKKGWSIVLDVGFNHTYDTYASNLQTLVPDYYHRQVRVTSQENKIQYKHDAFLQKGNLEPLYEGKIAKSDPSANELASERKMVTKLISDASNSFIKDYNVDGLRYDLMGIIPVTSMKSIKDGILSIKSGALLYGEGWGGATRLSDSSNNLVDQQNFPPQVGDLWDYSAEPTGLRVTEENFVNSQLNGSVAIFNKKFRDSTVGDVHITDAGNYGLVETSQSNPGKIDAFKYSFLGGSKVFGNSIYQPTTTSPQQYVNFLDIHDDYALSDHLSSYRLPPQLQYTNKLQRQKVAFSMLFLSQGIPIVHSGSEYGRSKKGSAVSEFFFQNNLQIADVVNNPALAATPDGLVLRNYVKGLLSLRNSDTRYRLNTAQSVLTNVKSIEQPTPNVIVFNISSPSNVNNVHKVIFNLSSATQKIAIESKYRWKINTAITTNTSSTLTSTTVSVPPLQTTLLLTY